MEEKHGQERAEHYLGVISMFLEREVTEKAHPKHCSLPHLEFLI